MIDDLITQIRIFPDGKMSIIFGRDYHSGTDDKVIFEHHLCEARKKWQRGQELIYIPVPKEDVKIKYPKYYEDGDM